VTTIARLAIGRRVTTAGIGMASPFEVLNSRTGTVVALGRQLVTVHLDYPVTADEVELMFGKRATLADVTDDETGHRVEMLARHLIDEATLLDPNGRAFRNLAVYAMREIKLMVRRDGVSEVWSMLAEVYDVDRMVAELPHTITTGPDARAWVHHRVAQDSFGL
jgi:hypothetical protein